MKSRLLRPTWAEVNLGNFRANLEEVARLVPEHTGILAVVKADAYGIGAVPASKVALTVPRVKGLAVATPEEALELRNAGVETMILILGPVTADAAEVMAAKEVSITITSPEAVTALQRIGQTLGTQVRVHIKIETGMGRIGAAPGHELERIIEALGQAPNVVVEGAFTHFAVSERDKDYTDLQMDRYENGLAQLAAAGIRPRYKHVANSAAILDYPRAYLDLVRPGIMLYGSLPDDSLSGKAEIKPVLSLFTRVSYVKEVPAGYSVGYGCTYKTSRQTKVATIPVGYADGYPRLLSNNGFALIHGKRFPIAGRVCMDQTMIDVGDEQVKVGDLVTLIGTDGKETVTVDELARRSETIAHEILTGITARVPRVYV